MAFIRPKTSRKNAAAAPKGGGGAKPNPLQALTEGIQNLLGGGPKKKKTPTGLGTQSGSGSKPGAVTNYRGPARDNDPAKKRPSDYFGNAEEGTIPDMAGLADDTLPDIADSLEAEAKEGRAQLDIAKEEIGGRQDKLETALDQGSLDARIAENANLTAINAAQTALKALPAQVGADMSKIRSEFEKQADIDVNRVEGLGREAVALAMTGQNAAAQAAVSAQQGASRDAIAQINADPSIPPSRKTAMINQVKMQGAMSIASTVGTNIAKFAEMQTGAMVSTMNAVGSALATKTQASTALAETEMSAVADAHKTVATLNQGYEQLSQQARENAVQTRFNYTNLRNSAYELQDQTALSILGEEARVSGIPTDALLLNYQLLSKSIGDQFSMDWQAKGYKDMKEAQANGDHNATMMMLSQVLSQFGGPLGFLPLLGMRF